MEGSIAWIEGLLEAYLDDPASVPEDWRRYFEENEAARGTNGGRRPSFQPASIFNPPGGAAPGRAHRVARKPVTTGDKTELIRSLGAFREMADDDVAEIAALAQDEELADREVLFRQGDAGNEMFILVSGCALIQKDGRIVAELGPGSVIGEMSVFDTEPRSATVIAKGPTHLLCLHGDDLMKRLDRPGFGLGVIRGLTHKLRERDSRQDRVDQLIRAYRVRGHLLADLDPLGPPLPSHRELELSYYDLDDSDLDSVFSTASIPGAAMMTLREILDRLRQTYCASIGVQFMHIDNLEKKTWLQNEMEDPTRHRRLTREEQLRTLTKLTDAEVFEQFIHKKFLGAKRFSLEGGETLIPLLDLAVHEAGADGVDEVVIGMAHRGRLNVLANIIGKSPFEIFREFDDADAHMHEGRGDVKYHLGYSNDFPTESGKSVHLSLTFNPSHLEFVGPVVQGRVRSKQEQTGHNVMGVVIHGDAAFAGQGVVQEQFNMSGLPGYRTGGTVHIVLNNQIGFTTLPEESRSTRYATDVARMLQTPIFHVNGEHPEAVAQVVRWAMDYRQRFGTDVIIDLYCYRKYGHNEGDEPAFTQPHMYRQIKQRGTVREGYLASLLKLEGVSREDADEIARRRREKLDEDLRRARQADTHLEPDMGRGVWAPYHGGPDPGPDVPTGVAKDTLVALLTAQATVPADFTPHPKIAKLLDTRRSMSRGETALDWGAGEALAFASLLAEGAPVRLSGQDSQRGTFSHRHAVLHDHEIDQRYVPLEHLGPDQGRFTAYNSPLTETAVLGFEFGYSLDCPGGLTVWEAQFGDFCNVGQVIFDQFIATSEDKWHRLNGLVVLLPHGFEGQGPEHSSARLERFFGLAAEHNIQIANLTTPAQLFHILRRQVRRPWRKPLVVMSPKSLLRHPRAVSTLDELATGRFQRVIPDVREGARETLVCSGKVYYDLLEARGERDDIALVRLEELYPFPARDLTEVLSGRVTWVQEEPRNMGAWPWLGLHCEAFDRCVARPESASPATGSHTAHQNEQKKLLREALGE